MRGLAVACAVLSAVTLKLAWVRRGQRTLQPFDLLFNEWRVSLNVRCWNLAHPKSFAKIFSAFLTKISGILEPAT
jgi:hypothetical protein